MAVPVPWPASRSAGSPVAHRRSVPWLVSAAGLLLAAAGSGPPDDPALSDQPIAVNQVGYETGRSKRFTAPQAGNGTRFVVRTTSGGPPLIEGHVQGGIGDFTALAPAPDARDLYEVEIDDGRGGRTRSDPFRIDDDLYRRQFWQPAVDFLIDSRSAVGTHPSAFGGCPWRDGTYYDAVIPALVLMTLVDPDGVRGMPRQIDWDADKARVTAATFRFDDRDPGAKGFLRAARAYYELEPPAADAPDVVKLIHWGAGMYLVNPETKDPSKDPDPRRIHPQTVEQVAYVAWAWPALRQWLPESFGRRCRDFCFEHWAPSLAIGAWWDPATYLAPDQLGDGNPMGGVLHPYKGRHAPGHSIVPNLLMHEVALRQGRDDADAYLEAAVRQAEWCTTNLDWNDPRTTKGQRMSEHRTIPNLVWLLQKYPRHAPAGLHRKIDAWADVAIARSDNLWDYRRYDLGEHWSIPKLNDVGNLVSFPAVATAAGWVVGDPGKRQRLEQIATAAVDHVFGRNPRLAAAPHQPTMGFPEIERGWPVHYRDGVCARLELCRGSISSAPGTEMFPFNPRGAPRHAEGWVNYGAAWGISLAYLRCDKAGTTPDVREDSDGSATDGPPR